MVQGAHMSQGRLFHQQGAQQGWGVERPRWRQGPWPTSGRLDISSFSGDFFVSFLCESSVGDRNQALALPQSRRAGCTSPSPASLGVGAGLLGGALGS